MCIWLFVFVFDSSYLCLKEKWQNICLKFSYLYLYLQYIPRKMHTVFALLCFVVVIHWLIFPYPSGLLHWHCGNLTIAPVPAKQPWWIWINTSCEFIMNDCITTTKQSTTKPCAYFLGYTVHRITSIWPWLRSVYQTLIMSIRHSMLDMFVDMCNISHSEMHIKKLAVCFSKYQSSLCVGIRGRPQCFSALRRNWLNERDSFGEISNRRRFEGLCYVEWDTLYALLYLCDGNPPVASGFPSQRASIANIWCFLRSYLEQGVDQTLDLSRINSAHITSL